ncbi:MAG TPA: class I SAM-dependent methyltransferase [Candidatus Baltobacteraceae bacterium]|nr:class I SAM-dependent methyltransferase [Candidatus Baltobacteraceae bacterium]
MDDRSRHGARQPHRFDPRRAGVLDDAERFAYLPPAEIVALLDLPRNAALVDFGTGTATYALEIARARNDVRVYALDEQEAMLERARAKIAASGLANVEAVGPGAMERLRGTVDRVLALNVLHELGDDALRELRALLSAGGAALFVDWDAAADRPVGPPRDHVYDAAAASERLNVGGFSVSAADARFRYHYALIARTAPPAHAGDVAARR